MKKFTIFLILLLFTYIISNESYRKKRNHPKKHKHHKVRKLHKTKKLINTHKYKINKRQNKNKV